MTITTLEISHFRNFRQLVIDCSPALNLIVGANASGKTSLLEAIYILSRGRSFRSHRAREIIHRESDSEAFRLVARVTAGGREFPLGVERSATDLNARIDGQTVRSLTELTTQLPVLLLDPDSHRLLEDGPDRRRRFMDWGLFQREPGFMPVWKRYRTAIKNRNAALRSGLADRDLLVWEQEMATAASWLDEHRDLFCAELSAALKPVLEATVDARLALEIDYRRGWNRDLPLAELLARDRLQDRQHGFTRAGPHRADFIVKSQGAAATGRLSRGQQKLVVTGLVLAQAELYRQRRNNPCVLLIDDLPAELDRGHRDRVMSCLAGQGHQLFVTAIEAESLNATAWPTDSRQTLRLSAGGDAEMV